MRRKTLAQLKAMRKRADRLSRAADLAAEVCFNFEKKFDKLLDESIDMASNMYCYWEDQGNVHKMKRYAKELKQLEKL